MENGNMTAEEMFKKLGYKKRDTGLSIEYCIYDENMNECVIEFDTVRKTVYICCDCDEGYNCTAFNLSKEKMKAIKKQIKELKQNGEW